MLTFSPHVDIYPLPNQCILFNNQTGRHLRLPNEALERLAQNPLESAPLRERLERLAMLDESNLGHLAQLFVCRSQLSLWQHTPARIWFPHPAMRTPGGHHYDWLELSKQQALVWAAINDTRSVRAIAERLQLDLETILSILTAWTTFDRQLVQLRERPPHPRDLGLNQLVSPPRPPNERTDDQFGDNGETTLLHYHLHSITDGSTHFDDRETTVAHALAPPHPALQGRSYGASLLEAIDRVLPIPQHAKVLEIGCGDGELARDYTKQATERALNCHYFRADLSPELLRTQDQSAPDTLGIHADGQALPFPDNTFELVLSNEVIADLSTVPHPLAQPNTTWLPELQTRLERYNIPTSKETQLLNLGAWKMLEEVSRVLKPGGLAFISEFGSLDNPPEQAVQLDHPEISIHFGILAHIAQGLGLTCTCLPLGDFLGMDYNAQQLSRRSWRALRAMARATNIHLAARAWTQATLEAELPIKLDGLRWVPMTDEGPGPLISRFLCLVIQKPKMPAK